MAKVAGLPKEFDDVQIIVSLHGMKHHGDTLDEAIKFRHRRQRLSRRLSARNAQTQRLPWHKTAGRKMPDHYQVLGVESDCDSRADQAGV